MASSREIERATSQLFSVLAGIKKLITNYHVKNDIDFILSIGEVHAELTKYLNEYLESENDRLTAEIIRMRRDYA